MNDLYEKIPTLTMPNLGLVEIVLTKEKMIDMKLFIQENNIKNIIIKPMYYIKGINNAINTIYVRESVAIKLQNIAKKIEKMDYELCLYDGWRSYETQSFLYLNYYEKTKENNPHMTKEMLHNITTMFVSWPTKNIEKPFLHNTGGAIDLTLSKNGIELDMGTIFDYFGEESNTSYYEKNDVNSNIKNNRRLLYNLMISEDFVNLPSEWWHYDYGDKVWGYYKNKDSIYNGIEKCI